ncbi:hypothetical protein LDENG_00083250 [Lucifuga dentata]|nr:hypothetical protein LDENG_00083250 [Lucifuga dentata]
MRQLELQSSLSSPGAGKSSPLDSAITFDVSKNIPLVPVFRESEVDSYFSLFERTAAALGWPQDVWAILLQCKLTGKAQEACASLSAADSLGYINTYSDFAREKGILFDRWCSVCKANDLNSLRELMLVEEFKNCFPEHFVTYLNEQKVATLQQAAVLADEFALTHKKR